MPISRKFRNYFFVATGIPGTRFLTGNEPTQSTFQQLFDSVGFPLESSDTATTGLQGFTKLVDDANAYALNSTPDIDGFSKVVQPHQLPTVVKSITSPLTSIAITKTFDPTGRIGGSGAQYQVQNTLSVAVDADPTNPIVVTQNSPGEAVELGFDHSLVPNTMEVTSVSSAIIVTQTAPGENVVLDFDTSVLPNQLIGVLAFNALLEIIPSGPADIYIKAKGRPWEVTMYGGTLTQYNTHFNNSNKGILGGLWEGWALCNGATYVNSVGVTLKTPDLRGAFPVGWDPSGNYPNLWDGIDNSATALQRKDAGGDSGNETYYITDALLPIVTPWPVTFNSFLQIFTPDVADNTGTGTHGFDYSTSLVAGTQATNSGGGQVVENRPPFFVMAYVQYIG
jgi:hypothetical protein